MDIILLQEMERIDNFDFSKNIYYNYNINIKEKKPMLNISEMIEKWGGTTKDCQDFEDVMNKALCLDRNCLLLDIVEGTGDFVHNVIYYWNKIDDANNVPIDKREPIKLYIDSNGGDLIQTFILIDSIRLSKTPVWTIGMGAVYSGGFFTFIAGHKRIAYPSSSFLYHEGATGTFGDAGKFRNYACFYEKQLTTLKNHTLKYTNIDEKTYDLHIKDDWWMTAEEALQYGVCDEIATEL